MLGLIAPCPTEEEHALPVRHQGYPAIQTVEHDIVTTQDTIFKYLTPSKKSPFL
jgi:hypothetical protein